MSGTRRGYAGCAPMARRAARMLAVVDAAAVAAIAMSLALARGDAALAAPAPLPTPLGYVSDFAHVVDPATARAITGRVEELKAKTGSEIAVVTVRTTKPDTPFDYAMRLAEAWKPGAAGKDNGVVFLVAVDDRELFILTGYGIEGALPDGLVGEIRDREVVPRFRAGDVAGGIRAGVERLAATIAREYGVTLEGAPAPAERSRARQPAPLALSPALLLVLLVLFFVVLPMLRSGVGGRRRRVFWGPPMWGGGFGGGGFGGPGGGFGGFGGGSFGGGGAGGKW